MYLESRWNKSRTKVANGFAGFVGDITFVLLTLMLLTKLFFCKMFKYPTQKIVKLIFTLDVSYKIGV